MPHAPHHAMRKARVPDRRHRNVPQRHHQIVIRRLPRHRPQRPVIRPPRIRPQPRVIQELKPPPRHVRIAPRRRVVPNFEQRGLKPNVVVHARRRGVRQPHVEPRDDAIHHDRRDQRDQGPATPTNGQWQSHRASVASPRQRSKEKGPAAMRRTLIWLWVLCRITSPATPGVRAAARDPRSARGGPRFPRLSLQSARPSPHAIPATPRPSAPRTR